MPSPPSLLNNWAYQLRGFLDNLNVAARSLVMSQNKSSGTKSTEKRFRSFLIRNSFRRWKLGHRSGLPGRPDFIFPSKKIAVFIDGCFWHGCSLCRTFPKANRPFWEAKLLANRRRDQQVAYKLRYLGWTVIRFWEHDLFLKDRTLLQKLRKKGINIFRGDRKNYPILHLKARLGKRDFSFQGTTRRAQRKGFRSRLN